MLKTRKDINELSGDQLGDYIHALNILRKRSKANTDDPNGYDYQAALHNDTTVGPCEHGNDLFLPWHRAHLHYFEQLLQQADPPKTSNVTIPYWDWLHVDPNGKFPARFSLEGLFSEGRNNADYTLPDDVKAIVTMEKDWNTFGGWPKNDPSGNDYGLLEIGPHNNMHGDYVGGLMGDPATAAEDAIYFSFHCFLDLLWAEWQKRNQFPAPTSANATLRGFTNQALNKVKDFFKCEELGYEYVYTDKLKQAFTPTQPVARFKNLQERSSLPFLFEGKLNDQFFQKSVAQFGIPKPEQKHQSVVVLLKDLAIPKKGSYTLFAYLHPKDVPFEKENKAFHQNYYVGYASLWLSHGGHHHHGHVHHGPLHPTSARIRFDITKLYYPLSEMHSNLVLTIFFRPSPDSTGKPQPESDVAKEIILKDIVLETSSN